jgi:hypothetical protein
MLRLLLVALIALGLLSAPVLAQEGTEEEFVMPDFKGMAVSQAPEAGLGICIGPDAAATMQCAQEACMTESSLGELDCAVNLWCYPHAFVADIFMQHREGIHWHEILCGQNDREILDRLIATTCDRDYLIECGAVRIWDHDGNEVLGMVDLQITVLE